jgi:hypothetical protein
LQHGPGHAVSTPTIDALVVLQRSDVAHLAAQRERFEGLRLFFFDPGLLEDALAQGLPGADFRRLDMQPDLQARAVTRALALATELDQRLTELRASLFDGGVFDGWDVGLFHLALQRLLVARQIGLACERAFPQGRLGVLRPNNPQQQYFDSFLVPDLVARDPARWSVLDGYDGARHHNAAAYDLGFDTDTLATLVAERPVGAITHVPTCFYDAARIASEVARVHDRSLDLPSLIWDVPVRRQQVLLRRLDALAAIDPAADVYAQRARGVLADTLAEWLPQPAGRQAQLDSWAARCRLQAINYTGLLRALRGHAPDFVLTDHDAGNNGPLYSVADALGARVFVLPHSAHPAMVLPHAHRVTAIERAGFATPVRTVLGQRVPLRPVRVDNPARRQRPERVRTLCLLLNTSHTDGLTYNDLLALVAFHTPLADLCRRHEVELLVRLKPGAPALKVMGGALGLSAETLTDTLLPPLDQIAQRSQLCVAFGEPSTGVLAFLDAGACVLNACPSVWPVDIVACPPLVADGVVPSLSLNDALHEVQRLLADPARLRRRCDEQADALARRAAGAQAHFFPDPEPATDPAGA